MTTTGFHTADELPADDYHASEGISNSGLKLLGRKTPAHYYAQYLDPQAPPRTSSKAQMMGTAIHAAALEPERFDEHYVVGEFSARNAKGYKAFAEAETRSILLRHEYDTVLAMRRSLWAHPIARNLLGDAGEFELSAYAHDPDTGVLRKIRVDLATRGGWLIDLKKTTDASPEKAAKDCYNYGYYHQAAYYVDTWALAAGERPQGFAFIFVEDSYPHECAVYVLDPDDEQRGRDEYRRNLETYAHCMASNHWPGYPPRAQTLGLPGWARRNLDEQLTEGLQP